MRRSAPAVALFLIAPFVAEFLLGNLSITVLSALVVLAPLYGGGAVLVREAICRAGRGWPSLLVLGLAFGVLEEAFLTQSLFNPDYLGLKLNLLAPAHIRFLGLGVWWTVFVLTLHAVWSIATSVALGEALFPERAKQPWLGRVGLVVATVLFILGCVAIAESRRSARVATEGWGARLLALQGEDGQWAGGACFPARSFNWRDENQGQPWTSTLPTLQLLRDFGVDPR